MAPADAIAAMDGYTMDDSVTDFVPRSWRVPWVSWWTIYLRPAPRSKRRHSVDFLNGPEKMYRVGVPTCGTPSNSTGPMPECPRFGTGRRIRGGGVTLPVSP